MKKLGLFAFAAFTFVACGTSNETSAETQPQKAEEAVVQQESAKQEEKGVSAVPAGDIDLDQLEVLLEEGKAKLVDVRTPGEFAEGIIGEAVNIDVTAPDFKEKIGELDKSQPVIVYCHSGRRSASAMAIMNEMGFDTVYNLKGGYSGYQMNQK